MKMKCPNCSAEMEYIEGESEICTECGSELKAAAESSDDLSADLAGKLSGTLAGDLSSDLAGTFASELSGSFAGKLNSGIDFAAIFGSGTSSDKKGSDEWNLARIAKGISDNIDDLDFTEMLQDGCSYLKVEYNHNLFFLTGSTSVIKLKLTPLDDQLQDLLVFMESERNGNYSRRQIPVREILQRDRAILLQVPFNPEDTCGRMPLVFYIGCKVSGAFTYYQFSVEHKIYDSRQSGAALCSQITINQEFTSNHAADINYQDSIGEALRKMAEKNLSVNEMIDRLNDLPPQYTLRQLAKTTWRPEDVLIQGNLYPADKLLLEFEDKTIFLLNKESVKLGRDREQVDLLVRCNGVGPRDYPNSTVSRKHAEILYCSDTVKLFDYSSYGTYINERKPDGAGIPLENSAMVEFGDICWKMNIQKCNARLPHNICQTCCANKVKSVTFTRTDSQQECYLLIWQCCELGRVIEELTDWTIFSRDGYFFIRTPQQDFYHLRPGQKITCKDKVIKVKFFEQN